jgi:hypothetical protein
MMEAVASSVPEKREERSHTWQTNAAMMELWPLVSESNRLCCLRSPLAGNSSQLLTKRLRLKRAIRRCIKHHRDKYRMWMATIVIKTRDAKMEKAALDDLTKWYDLSLKANPTFLPAVTPTVFKAHFENFFSKASEKENLGLMEE